jgi:hypothetical protein
MPGIVDPAFRDDKPGQRTLIGIDRNRDFEEMFPDLTGSFGVIVAAVPAGEPG